MEGYVSPIDAYEHAHAKDGTSIGFRSAGEGESLLLVHGAAADARQWDRLVPLLAPAFRVVCMDRRGRGASGPPRPGHSLETEYGDIEAVARSLVPPVHLLGHSSGARFSLHAAARIPGLASLILYEPPAPESLTDDVMAALTRLEDDGDRRGLLRLFFVDAVGMDDEDFVAMEARAVWPLMMDNALTLPAELRAVRGYGFDAGGLDAGGYTRVRVPTLLLLGELSDQYVADVTFAIAADLPDARVEVLAGQGHGAMFSDPELLAGTVQRFIAALGR